MRYAIYRESITFLTAADEPPSLAWWQDRRRQG
jgi:hypothetical protein